MKVWVIPVVCLFACCFDLSSHAGTPPAPAARTGQAACYGATSTAVVDCAGTGQDGETSAGVAWPAPRFVDNGDQTVTDKLTGLVWTRDANTARGHRSWQQALDSIKALNDRNHLGHRDWRLPNVNELDSLVNKQPELVSWLTSQGFDNVQKHDYWTSTTYLAYANCAWSVGMYSGIVSGRGKAEGGCVWPVRRGHSGVLGLPKTGQATCYDDAGGPVACAGTGQDGESQEGAAWPTPRFTENPDRTMTDGLTGLVWSKDANAPGPAACHPGARKTGQGALDHVKCLNASRYLGRDDWRLPNSNELATLVNHGQSDSAAWLGAQGFENVKAEPYWSSTTYVSTTWNAWGVNMRDGAVSAYSKRHLINVLPVRGGSCRTPGLPVTFR